MRAAGATEVVALTAAEAAAMAVRGFPARSAASFLDAAELARLEQEAARLFDRWAALPAVRELLDYDGVSLWVAAESSLQRRRGLFDALVARAAAPRIAAEGTLLLWGARDDPFLAALRASVEGAVREWVVPARGESLWRRRARAFVREYRRAHQAPLILPQKEGRGVLFFLYTSRHVALLRALWPQVEGWSPFVVAFGPDTEAALDKAGVPYTRLWGYFPPEAAVRRRLRGRWSAEAVARLGAALRDEAGRPLWPLLEAKVRRLFSLRPGEGRRFDETFLDAAGYVEAVRALLLALRPSLLVVMNDLRVLGRAAVLTARVQGVPTLHLQHGIMADWLLWQKVHSDRIAVWGEENRRALVEAGVAPGRIAVTGNPAFDRLAQGVEPERMERVRRSLRLEAGRPLLLVTTQNDSFAASRRQIEAVVVAAREFPALQIVVKLHPADAFAPYQRLQRELAGVDLHLTQHSDLAALLALSDLLVTRFSTTALEAMLQGKPVIVLNFSGQPDPLPYVERGAALGVRDPSALPGAIRAVLEDEPTRRRLREGMARFVRDYAYRLDGRAGERVLALMEEMMEAR